MQIQVSEGEQAKATDNNLLGKLHFDDIPSFQQKLGVYRDMAAEGKIEPFMFEPAIRGYERLLNSSGSFEQFERCLVLIRVELEEVKSMQLQSQESMPIGCQSAAEAFAWPDSNLSSR